MSKFTFDGAEMVSGEGYHKSGWCHYALYRFVIDPVLNMLPARAHGYVRRTHALADDAIKYRTTHKALEVLYTGGHEKASRTLTQKLFHWLWMNTNNARAVQNRLVLTERLIEEHVRMLLHKDGVKHIELLSIASGSARSFVTILPKLVLKDGQSVRVTFLDKKLDALQYSEDLIKGVNLHPGKFQFRWVQGTANTFLNNDTDVTCYNLVEMVGLLDYFDDQKVRTTFRSIRKRLCSDGALITANIIPNGERGFVTKVMDWRMIYRLPNEFAKLVVLAGFAKSTTRVFVEPLRVHTVVKTIRE